VNSSSSVTRFLHGDMNGNWRRLVMSSKNCDTRRFVRVEEHRPDFLHHWYCNCRDIHPDREQHRGWIPFDWMTRSNGMEEDPPVLSSETPSLVRRGGIDIAVTVRHPGSDILCLSIIISSLISFYVNAHCRHDKYTWTRINSSEAIKETLLFLTSVSHNLRTWKNAVISKRNRFISNVILMMLITR